MDNKETRTIILDGGTGTMLQARGMKAGEDSTAFALAHLDVIEDVARQYIEAGAQAVYSPTFNLTRDKVAGFGETVESLCLKLSAPARRLREEYAAKGRTILLHFHHQSISVAISGNADDVLVIAAGFSLEPQLLPGSAPEAGKSALHGDPQALPVHPGHH